MGIIYTGELIWVSPGFCSTHFLLTLGKLFWVKHRTGIKIATFVGEAKPGYFLLPRSKPESSVNKVLNVNGSDSHGSEHRNKGGHGMMVP